MVSLISLAVWHRAVPHHTKPHSHSRTEVLPQQLLFCAAEVATTPRSCIYICIILASSARCFEPLVSLSQSAIPEERLATLDPDSLLRGDTTHIIPYVASEVSLITQSQPHRRTSTHCSSLMMIYIFLCFISTYRYL